tara:strand:+ start:445 stop:603 length:159 start_codon:yes stop_codon:yes gene_type:complete
MVLEAPRFLEGDGTVIEVVMAEEVEATAVLVPGLPGKGAPDEEEATAVEEEA